jgi:flagellar motility protein MotE (MotC chaperone)
MPLPPALSDSALRDELRASSRRRQEELAALARERARIEKLTADIAGARTALREETARLDERVKKVAAERATARGAAGGAGRGDKEAVALARTLKGMKPDQAAALVARLDRPLAIDLLRRMRPGDLAVVLEKLKPELAAELFSMMAGGGR